MPPCPHAVVVSKVNPGGVQYVGAPARQIVEARCTRDQVVTQIIQPVFGNRWLRCNATSSYRCVPASQQAHMRTQLAGRLSRGAPCVCTHSSHTVCHLAIPLPPACLQRGGQGVPGQEALPGCSAGQRLQRPLPQGAHQGQVTQVWVQVWCSALLCFGSLSHALPNARDAHAGPACARTKKPGPCAALPQVRQSCARHPAGAGPRSPRRPSRRRARLLLLPVGRQRRAVEGDRPRGRPFLRWLRRSVCCGCCCCGLAVGRHGELPRYACLGTVPGRRAATCSPFSYYPKPLLTLMHPCRSQRAAHPHLSCVHQRQEPTLQRCRGRHQG